MIDEALTQKDVAQKLGVSVKTVRKWTKAGLLPVWFHTEDGRAVYSASTIEAHQRRAGELHAERSAS